MLGGVREYRIPIVLTVLMLLGLSFLTWHAWQHGDEHALEKERYRAEGVYDMLAGGLRALDRNRRLGLDEIEKVLADILNASSYRFLILEQGGQPLLRIGDVPAGWALPTREGESVSNGLFFYSRKIRLQGSVEIRTFWQRLFSDESSDLGLMPGEHLLILGGSIQNDNAYEKAVQHLFVPFTVALLLLIVSATAWIMKIRNRLLSEQLKMERVRTAHLEDLGLAAAGLAHETKNPLGIISGIAQQIVRDPQVPEQSRILIEAIIDEVDKSASRLGHFMTFARRREIAVASFDLRKLIDTIAEILQPEFNAAGVSLETDCSAWTVVADEEMLRQILVNLLLNSLQASSPGSVIKIRIKRHGSHVSLVVEDQGHGIAPELLSSIFKPYVTGSPTGHGLGLAIVKRFAEDHGWTVEAESQLDHGTRIEVSGIALVGEARSRV